MPPPKKPKSGPTSLEQFFSKEELEHIDPDRDIRDRKGSCSGESDTGQESPKNEDAEISDPEQRPLGLTLLRELMIKKKNESGEQRVPSSNDGSRQDSPAINDNSLLETSDVNCDIKKEENSTEVKTEIKFTENHSSCTSPEISPTSEREAIIPPRNVEKNLRQNAAKLSKTEEKELNSMIVSSYMASLPRNTTLPSVPSYISPYLYNHSFPMSSFYMNGVEEPTDLSRKIQKEKRLADGFDHASGFSEQALSQPLSMNFAVNSLLAPKPDDKEYLKSRKNLVGMLTEPEYVQNTIGFPVQQIEREHPINSFHFFMNGFESRRDSIEKINPQKEEHHHGINMSTPGSYITMPHNMFSGVSQMPSSTTPDFHDHAGRMLPMLDPSMSFIDGRKLKHESSVQHSNKLCQVCSDNASGFHYGVWSCEGCKAFFKRSIQGPVDYVCPATNTCTIDKHRRKSCQACRLRKCYEVGMNKGTQRKERKSSSSLSNSMSKQTLKRGRADSMDNTVNSTSGGSPNPGKSPRRSQTVAILDALTKADLPIVESFHNHGIPPSRVHLLNSLSKLAERELVHLINWAKNVPGYIELSLSDQVHLIECCWMELLLLNCAFRSMEHEGKRLVFAPDLILDRSHWETVGMTEILEQVAAVSEQMVYFHLHKDEILLLQATVLVNAEVRRLSSFGRIYDMRQSILDALVDVAQKYHPDNLRHVPSVLLLLTHIRQAGERGISHFQRLKNEGVVSFSDLLKEMLDAHSCSEKKVSNETE